MSLNQVSPRAIPTNNPSSDPLKSPVNSVPVNDQKRISNVFQENVNKKEEDNRLAAADSADYDLYFSPLSA